MNIKNSLYSKIHELMPIACIDLVIIKRNKILLIKRKKQPAINQYWFPGGRILRNESFANAAKRIAKNEVGLTIKKLEHIGIGNLLFKESPFNHNKGTHTVTFVYRCHTSDTPTLDNNHSDYIWWSGNGNIKHHQYIRDFGKKAK